jgi:hypothetical protein
MANIEQSNPVHQEYNYRNLESRKLLCSMCTEQWRFGFGKARLAKGVYIFKLKEGDEASIALCKDLHDEEDYEELGECINLLDASLYDDVASDLGFIG